MHSGMLERERENFYNYWEREREERSLESMYINSKNKNNSIFIFFSERDSHITQIVAVDERSDHDFSCYVISENV